MSVNLIYLNLVCLFIYLACFLLVYITLHFDLLASFCCMSTNLYVCRLLCLLSRFTLLASLQLYNNLAACLPYCLSTRLPFCPVVCLTDCLFTWLTVYPVACLSSWQSTWLHANLTASLAGCPSTWLSIGLDWLLDCFVHQTGCIPRCTFT